MTPGFAMRIPALFLLVQHFGLRPVSACLALTSAHRRTAERTSDNVSVIIGVILERPQYVRGFVIDVEAFGLGEQ